MKFMLLALCAAATVLPGAAAVANTAANPFVRAQSVVRADDLDLTRADDRLRLETRLATAAEEVCGRGMDRLHNIAKDKARTCKAEVLAESRAQYQTLVARAGSGQALALAN